MSITLDNIFFLFKLSYDSGGNIPLKSDIYYLLYAIGEQFDF